MFSPENTGEVSASLLNSNRNGGINDSIIAVAEKKGEGKLLRKVLVAIAGSLDKMEVYKATLLAEDSEILNSPGVDGVLIDNDYYTNAIKQAVACEKACMSQWIVGFVNSFLQYVDLDIFQVTKINLSRRIVGLEKCLGLNNPRDILTNHVGAEVSDFCHPENLLKAAKENKNSYYFIVILLLETLERAINHWQKCPEVKNRQMEGFHEVSTLPKQWVPMAQKKVNEDKEVGGDYHLDDREKFAKGVITGEYLVRAIRHWYSPACGILLRQYRGALDNYFVNAGILTDVAREISKAKIFEYLEAVLSAIETSPEKFAMKDDFMVNKEMRDILFALRECFVEPVFKFPSKTSEEFRNRGFSDDEQEEVKSLLAKIQKERAELEKDGCRALYVMLHHFIQWRAS